MDGIMNIDENIGIDDLLGILEITPDDSANLQDGEDIYYFYSFSNLSDETKEILLEIGFKEFKENIFFIETDTIRTNLILDHLIPVYQKNEIEKWDKIINKMARIHERKYVFHPTFRQIMISVTWKGKLTQNEDEFKSFIMDICLLFRESCKKGNRFTISEKCRSHNFWKIIGDLRNYYYSHDAEHWGEQRYNEAIDKANLAFKDLFPDQYPDKKPISYINAQSKLLDKCLDFLDLLIGEV